MEEFILSAFLTSWIIAFGAGYWFGYRRFRDKSRPTLDLGRYRYNREGDTSCK